MHPRLEYISAPAPDGIVRMVKHHLTKILIKYNIPQCFSKLRTQEFSNQPWNYQRFTERLPGALVRP